MDFRVSAPYIPVFPAFRAFLSFSCDFRDFRAFLSFSYDFPMIFAISAILVNSEAFYPYFTSLLLILILIYYSMIRTENTSGSSN